MRSARPDLRRLSTRALIVLLLGVVVGACAVGGDPRSSAGTQTTGQPAAVAVADLLDYRSLDGSGNNLSDATLGQAGLPYARVAEASYADGVGELRVRPNERFLSNRIFNDGNQNIFSEKGVTHWAFVWGQFLDHTFANRETSTDEELVIAFDASDPLEEFTNDLGAITTTRSAAADGTGVDEPREQINLLSSYIDAWAVYGGSEARLDWLRDGPVDGDPTNNDATLLTVDGYLPTAMIRSEVEAPETDLIGRLLVDPTAAVIAGDVRVNENIGLTAAHTLFVREHNRIVAELPDTLDEEVKFQIARRVVSALQQWITYEEFLPAMGVELDSYAGYDPSVDPSITNEFATVGYRAHSQIHGEFEAVLDLEDFSDAQLDALRAQGASVDVDHGEGVAGIAVPLNVAYGNPGLLQDIGLGNLAAGLASEAAYANDEQIDNQLRSVLFQLPRTDAEDLACLDGTEIASCFSAVNDLGALDVLRTYDHGIPTYNELRMAFGLDPVESFVELTGESTESFQDDGEVNPLDPINDPDILDFLALLDADGNALEPGSEEAVAARLAGVFGDVDAVDAFTGMVAEPHVPGTEFGELQLAMWTQQFSALRDGDRYFYANDPTLEAIADAYGIDYRRTLAEVIATNTDVDIDDLSANVFLTS